MNKNLKNNIKSGHSFIEFIVVVAVIAATISLGKAWINFLSSVLNQRSHLEIQLEAQTVLYDIIKNARNASAIVECTSSTLVLQVFDNQNYDYDDVDLYNSVNIGSITYAFVPTAGEQKSYLSKKIWLPSNGTTVLEKKYLVGMIYEPVEGDNYMFRPEPYEDPPPYEYVLVNLNVLPKFMKRGDPKVFRYSGVSMKRARSI